MTITLRRRDAIAAGLRPWLREDQIAIALQALEEEAAFNLQRFADRVYDRLMPQCARRDFHRSLVQSVFLGGQGEQGPEGAGDGAEAAETQVFEKLLGGFLKALGAQQGAAEAAVRAYLQEKIERFELSGAGRQALMEWLGGHRGGIAAPIGREAMRQMVNLSYVLACEYLGPVAADRLLSQAVKDSELLPEARAFPPRALL